MMNTMTTGTERTFLFSLARVSVLIFACHLLLGTVAAATEVPQRGPAILVVAPVQTAVVSTPCDLDIRFELPGLTAVDLSTLRVTVLKLWEIDITERVRPYASPEGISMTQVDLPKGEHTFRIAIADEDGRRTAQTLSVTVQ